MGHYGYDDKAHEQAEMYLDKYVLCNDSYLIEILMEKLPQEFSIDNLENFYSPDDIDEPQEIFEWWRVTEWFGEQLIEQGEPVLVNDYGSWWGRTVTGQNIILDGTLQQIAISHGIGARENE